MNDQPVPRLFAATRPLEALPELIDFAHRTEPMLWVRGDRGFLNNVPHRRSSRTVGKVAKAVLVLGRLGPQVQ